MSHSSILLVLNLTVNVGKLQGGVESTVHFHLVPISKNRFKINIVNFIVVVIIVIPADGVVTKVKGKVTPLHA
jgi:diadenosine tetraphosphate (Ap4A) HIT family hydrolase